MADLQNISFTSIAPALRVTRVRVEFQYRANVTDQWRTFTYLIPDDMFDIRPDDRERIAIDLAGLPACIASMLFRYVSFTLALSGYIDFSRFIVFLSFCITITDPPPERIRVEL